MMPSLFVVGKKEHHVDDIGYSTSGVTCRIICHKGCASNWLGSRVYLKTSRENPILNTQARNTLARPRLRILQAILTTWSPGNRRNSIQYGGYTFGGHWLCLPVGKWLDGDNMNLPPSGESYIQIPYAVGLTYSPC